MTSYLTSYFTSLSLYFSLPLFTSLYFFLPLFTGVYLFPTPTSLYLSASLSTSFYLFLALSTSHYPLYSCLPLFTFPPLPLLPLSISLYFYPCLPLFTRFYPVYHCLPLYLYRYYLFLPLCTHLYPSTFLYLPLAVLTSPFTCTFPFIFQHPFLSLLACPYFSHFPPSPTTLKIFQNLLIQNTVAFVATTSRLPKTRRKIETANRNQNTSQRIKRTGSESAKTHPSKCRSDTVDKCIGFRRRSVKTSAKGSFWFGGHRRGCSVIGGGLLDPVAMGTKVSTLNYMTQCGLQFIGLSHDLFLRSVSFKFEAIIYYSSCGLKSLKSCSSNWQSFQKSYKNFTIIDGLRFYNKN